MRSKQFSLGLTAVLALFTATLLMWSTRATAQTESVLYSFGVSTTDADVPFASLIFDGAGTLYGTTSGGGAYSQGAVFELSPKAGGGWKEKVLHSFNNTGNGGYFPDGALIMDAAGNLYGTTVFGGDGTCTSGSATGCGTVFELMPVESGSWRGKVLHEFGVSSEDGSFPEASLIFDSAGNLYGTTYGGGAHAGGIVFELSPTVSGGWTEKLLHTFNGAHDDGTSPHGSLIFDSAGNLYGTTVLGGTYAGGTVFELTPATGGHWTEKVLHDFSDTTSDGGYPEASLIFDGSGNLYSTTLGGGTTGNGTVFELAPAAGGAWTETVLHNFADNGTDGFLPVSGLIFDASGNLYGTTNGGGAYAFGIAFELTPAAGGSWTETVVHNFDADGTDGSTPAAGLISDTTGNLYGTTAQGGAHGGGIVFEITP